MWATITQSQSTQVAIIGGLEYEVIRQFGAGVDYWSVYREGEELPGRFENRESAKAFAEYFGGER